MGTYKSYLFYRQFLKFRCFSSLNFSEDCIDWNYFEDPSNMKYIESNALSRNSNCDIKEIIILLDRLHSTKADSQKHKALKNTLSPLLYSLPNKTHPKVAQNTSSEPTIVEKFGKKLQFTYFPASFDNICKRLNFLRTKFLGHMCGNKGYYLKYDLASLEHSLVQYSLSKLLSKGFQMVSVPDILKKNCFEECGMGTINKHSMVYHVDSNWMKNLCLSGTSEIALASLFGSKTFTSSDLPLKFCAVSRCYRAEANRHQKEKGIFRVHHFTKVEMFGITSNNYGNESENLLEEFTSIQKEMFIELGLHFKVLEMPPCDLGLPAFHKIDMEAWIPSQKIYGEISSASNCTDYQSLRLNTRYVSSGNVKYCHTVNGTACAIPRLLIAILENFQNLNGSINVPIPLQRFMKKKIINNKFKEIMLTTKPIP